MSETMLGMKIWCIVSEHMLHTKCVMSKHILHTKKCNVQTYTLQENGMFSVRTNVTHENMMFCVQIYITYENV